MKRKRKQRGKKAEVEKSTRRGITDRNFMQRRRRLTIIQTNWA